ncbi:hypothetical protein [Leifsonia aquatica]|uniref:hypothetical protein n=1 Tax=Leifsonia aquatica TaxID=144185 RepID=UPI0038044B3E
MHSPELIALASCESDQDEYWYHVAPQDQMPLAGSSRPQRLLAAIDEKVPDSEDYQPGQLTREEIVDWLYEDADIVNELRLVLSISDKRFYLDASYLFSRATLSSQPTETICGCLPHKMKKHSTAALISMIKRGPDERRRAAAEVVAHYLIGKNLLVVLDLYFSLDQIRRNAINDAWLAPHDVQQNETKRRGHGAEAEIAAAFDHARLVIIPSNKAADPMGAADPNISLETFQIEPRVADKTISADIVVSDADGDVRIMVMGLVQSSDPGQFGVDKAATNRAIRTRLDAYRAQTGRSVEIWGIVDGIGYAENPPRTVYAMLESFDYFVQHNSAYKAVLGAARLGLCHVEAIRYDSSFYTLETANQMHAKYGAGVPMLTEADAELEECIPVALGRATVYLPS